MAISELISLTPWKRRGRFTSDCAETLAGMTAVRNGLGDVIGAFDKREDADMAASAPALLAALRAILPYAESRLEDMEEELEAVTDAPHGVGAEAEANVRKARAAFQAAKNAIAAAEGRADG